MVDVLPANASRIDPTSITGISYLINQDKADRNLELDSMEQAIVNPGLLKGYKPINPDEEFVRIMRGLGIDANDESIVDLVDRSASTRLVDPRRADPRHSQPSHDMVDSDEELESIFNGRVSPPHDEPSRWNMREPPAAYAAAPMKPQTNEPIPLSSFKPRETWSERNESQNNYGSQGGYGQGQYGNYSGYSQSPQHSNYPPYPPNNYGYPQAYANQNGYNGYNGYNGQNGGYSELDQGLMNYQGGYQNYNERMLEDQEDTKIILLEDINELRDELQTMGKTITGIDNVSADTNYATIKRVHERLRRRYDHARGETLGTDFILAVAQGLGSFFDGTRKVGPWRPYLKGWHNTVRPKLRRMRYETATTVSNILTAYDIGPSTRMIIELAPSAVIYSWQHSGEDKDYQYTPDQVASAYEDLRDLA